MAGKNKLERGTRVSIDDSGGNLRDISTGVVPGSLSINGITYEKVSMQGINEAINNYLAGFGELEIAFQIYLDDTATTGAWTVANGNNGGTGSVDIRMGSAGEAPTTGDPKLTLEALYTLGSLSPSGGRWTQAVSLVPTGSAGVTWGTV